MGLIYSRFLLSMSIIGVSSLLLLPQSRGGQVLPSWSRLLSDRKVWLGLLIIYAGVVLSGINSRSIDGWLHHLRIRLPLLTLPLALFSASPLRRDVWRGLVLLFMAILTISSIPILWEYTTNYYQVQEAIGRGIAMETPTSHIRYSLMVAFGVLSGGYFWMQGRSWPVAVLTIWLYLFLHILAVRSGIAVFYAATIVLLLHHAIINGRWKQPMAGLIILLLAGAVAIETVPSLNRRISYMRYDLDQYRNGDGSRYSDSERITSLQAAYYLTKNNPLLGVGIGDLKDEIAIAYEQLALNSERSHLPHNQFLFVSAGSGLLGLAIFVTGYCWLLYYSRRRVGGLILLLLAGASFMVEHTLDTAVGVGFFTLLLCLSLWSVEADT